MKRAFDILLLIAGIGLGLSGCESAKQALGLGKFPPNEFEVVTHPPLAMPPNDDLVPPEPGAPRPQEETATQLAEAAVVGSIGVDPASGAGSATPGEQAFLQTAGASNADPKIRQIVNKEAEAESQAIKDSLYNKLIFWQTPEPPGIVIDPKAEQQRLQENAALGKPLTTGSTPVITRRKKALLQGIF
jgi:Protein of unknown function (DUF3035)